MEKITQKLFNQYQIIIISQLDSFKISINKKNSLKSFESNFHLKYFTQNKIFNSYFSIKEIIDCISRLIEQNKIKIVENEIYLKIIFNFSVSENFELTVKQIDVLGETKLIKYNLQIIKLSYKNNNNISIISIFPSGNIITVLNNHSIQIYNDKMNILQHIENAHNDYIKNIQIKDENNFITNSSKDIKTWIKIDNIFKLNKIIENAHDNWITKVIYYSNENISSCSLDCKIKIWEELNNNYQINTILNHSDWIFSILLLKDKNILISSGVDGTKLYNLNNFEFIIYIKEACCLSPNSLKRIDEDRIIIGEGCIDIMKIISISEKKIINEIENEFYRYGICIIKEKGIFLTGGRGGIIRIYKINNYQCIQIIENAYGHFNNYDIIPIINGIIELKNRLIITYSNDNNLKIWEFKD